MKIAAVKTIALGGATHDHGWPGGTDPNVQYNTLVEVDQRRRHRRHRQLLHDAGARRRLAAAFEGASDRRIGAGAGAGQRKAAAEHVLARPRRQRRAHDQRHRHRAVGFARQGAQSARLAAARRLLSRPDQALCVDPVRRSADAAREAARAARPRLQGDQDGLAAVWPRQPAA